MMNLYEIMVAVAASLDDTSITYMMVGAFASNFYGVPRSTMDGDFVLMVSEFPIANLGAALGPSFHIDPQSHIETFTMGTYYALVHLESRLSVDLFLHENDPHGAASFSRRIQVDFENTKVFIPTAEDVVITKLRWSQGGRRLKDLDDARGVLAVQAGRLDMAYIRHWCDIHQTLDVLESQLLRARKT